MMTVQLPLITRRLLVVSPHFSFRSLATVRRKNRKPNKSSSRRPRSATDPDALLVNTRLTSIRDEPPYRLESIARVVSSLSTPVMEHPQSRQIIDRILQRPLVPQHHSEVSDEDDVSEEELSIVASNEEMFVEETDAGGSSGYESDLEIDDADSFPEDSLNNSSSKEMIADATPTNASESLPEASPNNTSSKERIADAPPTNASESFPETSANNTFSKEMTADATPTSASESFPESASNNTSSKEMTADAPSPTNASESFPEASSNNTSSIPWYMSRRSS